MSSSFAGSSSDEVRPGGSEPGSFDEDDRHTAYDPRLSSQSFDSLRFDSFANYGDGNESTKEGVENMPSEAGDEVFVSQPIVSPPSANSSGGVFSPERNGNGPILPQPADMQPEEGYALREWRRLNAIRLEEKEKREKEILKEIILDAEEYKKDYYKKWKLRCESNRAANREKEKSFLESREKFHAEASKSYWKAIGELIPNEVPIIEKKGKKDREKKPTIVVIQGPKPGKPTDLSRMRQILVRLKHNPPPHVKNSPPPSLETRVDAKTATVAAASNVPAKSGLTGSAEVSSTAAK